MVTAAGMPYSLFYLSFLIYWPEPDPIETANDLILGILQVLCYFVMQNYIMEFHLNYSFTVHTI